MNLVQTEDKDLHRDVNTMSLLNTNKQALLHYKEEKRKAAEFQQVKKDVAEIKTALAIILEKLNNGS